MKSTKILLFLVEHYTKHYLVLFMTKFYSIETVTKNINIYSSPKTNSLDIYSYAMLFFITNC